MSIRKRRVKRNSLLSSCDRLRIRILWSHELKESQRRVAVSQTRIGLCIIGVQAYCRLKKTNRTLEISLRPLVPRLSTAQVAYIRLSVPCYFPLLSLES